MTASDATSKKRRVPGSRAGREKFRPGVRLGMKMRG